MKPAHRAGFVVLAAISPGRVPSHDLWLTVPHRIGAGSVLISRTDGGRVLSLVIERTVDPTTWLVITGWSATARERKIIG